MDPFQGSAEDSISS